MCILFGVSCNIKATRRSLTRTPCLNIFLCSLQHYVIANPILSLRTPLTGLVIRSVSGEACIAAISAATRKKYLSLQGKGAVFRVRPYSPAPRYPENSSYLPAPLFFKGVFRWNHYRKDSHVKAFRLSSE